MQIPNPQMPSHLASNPFEDFSGVSTSSFPNPYDALLEASNNDAVRNLFAENLLNVVLNASTEATSRSL
jgi:hypothetical protein